MIYIYLKVENISYGFKANTLFEDLSFSMAQGEVLSLIGPSGEGKTTLLKILAGLIMDYKGEVYLEDHKIDDTPANKRECVLAGVSTPLFEHMTVFENIAFGLKFKKIDKPSVKKEVSNLLEKINLLDLADRKPSQVSQGQYQRILLARALVLNPKLILLDEPLSSIDHTLKIEFRQQILDMLSYSKTTAIIVTHDMEDAFYMSNRVGVLLNKSLTMLHTNAKPLYKNKQVESYLADLKIIEGEIINNKFIAPEITFFTNATEGRYRLLLTHNKSILLNKIATD